MANTDTQPLPPQFFGSTATQPKLPDAKGDFPVGLNRSASVYDDVPELAMMRVEEMVDPTAFINEKKTNWALLAMPFIAAAGAKMTGKDTAKAFNQFVNVGKGWHAGNEILMQRKVAGVKESNDVKRYNNAIRELKLEKMQGQVGLLAKNDPNRAARLNQALVKNATGIEISFDESLKRIQDGLKQENVDELRKNYTQFIAAGDVEGAEQLMFSNLDAFGINSEPAIESLTRRLLHFRNAGLVQENTDKIASNNSKAGLAASNKALALGQTQETAELALENAWLTQVAEGARLRGAPANIEEQKTQLHEKIWKHMLLFGSSTTNLEFTNAMRDVSKQTRENVDPVTMGIHATPENRDQVSSEMMLALGKQGNGKSMSELKMAAYGGFLALMKNSPEMFNLPGGGSLGFGDVMPTFRLTPEEKQSVDKENGIGSKVSVNEAMNLSINAIDKAYPPLPAGKRLSPQDMLKRNSGIYNAILDQVQQTGGDGVMLKNLMDKYGLGPGGVAIGGQASSQSAAPIDPAGAKPFGIQPAQVDATGAKRDTFNDLRLDTGTAGSKPVAQKANPDSTSGYNKLFGKDPPVVDTPLNVSSMTRTQVMELLAKNKKNK